MKLKVSQFQHFYNLCKLFNIFTIYVNWKSRHTMYANTNRGNQTKIINQIYVIITGSTSHTWRPVIYSNKNWHTLLRNTNCMSKSTCSNHGEIAGHKKRSIRITSSTFLQSTQLNYFYYTRPIVRGITRSALPQ